jgi:hypothetical protein
MYLQMDPFYNPLVTRPIQMDREMAIKLDPNRQVRFIDNPERQSVSGSVPTRTRTGSHSLEPLLTLVPAHSLHLLPIPLRNLCIWFSF